MPDPPAAPTMESQYKTDITIRWTPTLYNGGVPIESYGVYVKLDATSYTLASTHSDLTNLVYTHSVPTADIGKTFSFEITAINEVGESIRSASISIIAGTVPSAPLTLGKVTSDIDHIAFSWGTPADDGGTPLIDYKIYWDNGSGSGLILL